MVYEAYAYSDRINFTNAIMVDKSRNPGEQRLHYKLEKMNRTGTFDILNNTSEHVTLLQLMDSLGNVNNAVSVVGMWIFDPN